MAITFYTGVSGAGKSFALMSEVIVPAVVAGRRVLTNIAGVDPEKVAAYCEAKHGAPPSGSVVLFDGPDTLDPGFFPDKDHPDAVSVLQAGDLLVMDEVFMYWPASGRFPAAISKFMRYHRHFVRLDGLSTDVCLGSQVITDFHRDYKGNGERNYKFKKLNTVGMPSRYVWNMWEGSTQVRSAQAASGGGKYDPEIFALYKSFMGDGGKELKTDKRARLVSKGRLAFYVVAAVAALSISGIAAVRFFKPAVRSTVASAAPNGVGVVGAPGSALAPRPVVPNRGAPPVSVNWRIAGTVSAGAMNVVVLVDRAGNVRYERPEAFEVVGGRPYSGVYEGERVLAGGAADVSTSGAALAVMP